MVRWCDRTADNEWGALTFRGGPLITHQDVVELCRRCHCRTTLELALALGRYDGSGASEGFRPCFAPSSVQTSIIMSFDFCRCHNHCLAGAWRALEFPSFAVKWFVVCVLRAGAVETVTHDDKYTRMHGHWGQRRGSGGHCLFGKTEGRTKEGMQKQIHWSNDWFCGALIKPAAYCALKSDIMRTLVLPIISAHLHKICIKKS